MPAFAAMPVAEVLQAAMKTATMNQRVIANNIANVDTPHFTPVEMDFQDTLRAVIEGRDRFSLRRADSRHLEGTRNLVRFQRLAKSSKNDYNKVDLDSEVVKLNENTGRYTTYGSLLIKRYQQLRDMLNNIR